MTARTVTAAALLLTSAFSTALQAEGRLAQLYAPRPPADSAFVRVLQPAGKATQVQVGPNAPQPAGSDHLASAYNVVEGGKPFTVQIDGATVGTLSVAAGNYQSVMLDGGTLRALPEASAGDNALKAELRFYNLVADCPTAQLQLKDGLALFTEVSPFSNQARAINPVSASLQAGCASAQTDVLAMPLLQPGDHYVLFLTGSAAAPTLRGELSRTAPWTR
ncbi:alginate O-acetyltransferase AlgF [Pseudomonas sp.]|uniref:alginate O-acetyltransferase AlgF n=1 Tax=Pseudomonas sp. TaxID=306 RepID=UPI0028ACA9BE|nr:alginate O-acetyltransferase AlgF [Pseudomonas sp.]